MKVMRHLLGRLTAIRDQIDSWGIRVPTAPAAVGPSVDVLIESPSGDLRHVGTLSQDGPEFVFRYSPAYASASDATPIPEFPEMGNEYRSRELWPFFAIRIPPVERSDVHEALARRGISSDQVLDVLELLGKRTIANPYRLERSAA